MSNSFTSPPLLVDPGRVSASQTIRTTEASRLGDLQNYCFAQGGCGDVVNQYWDREVLRVDSTSQVQVCEWYIPRPSNIHGTFKFRVIGFGSKAGGSALCEIKFALSGNSYTASTSITDTSRYGTSFEEISVTVPNSETETFVICRMYVTAPTAGYVEINGIQGRWEPLTSPLSNGALGQGSESFIPQGVNRLGADLPLPSRFGVETIENITLLRKRGRTLFNWSGCTNAQAGASGQVVPSGLGLFDPQIMFSYAALFAGMREVDLEVNIFINVENYVANTPFDIFGHRLTPVQNGWNSFGVTLRHGEQGISGEFNLSMYRVGLEDTSNNRSKLLSQDNLLSSSPMYIKGLSIIGV